MTEDPTILDAMLKTELGKAQAAASALGRKFQRLADFLEDMADIKSDDRDQIQADVVRASALAIQPYYDTFRAAVSAVRDLTQEDWCGLVDVLSERIDQVSDRVDSLEVWRSETEAAVEEFAGAMNELGVAP